MRMPGFTGESSLYKTERGYFMSFGSGIAHAQVTPQQQLLGYPYSAFSAVEPIFQRVERECRENCDEGFTWCTSLKNPAWTACINNPRNSLADCRAKCEDARQFCSEKCKVRLVPRARQPILMNFDAVGGN